MGLIGQKKKLNVSGSSAGPGSRETSNLRPYQIGRLAPCMNRCPNQTNIRGILTTISQAEKKEIPYEVAFHKAWEIIADKNPFPAVCGRVCPHPCEEDCNRSHKDGAVSINNIERFIGDWALTHDFRLPNLTGDDRPENPPARTKRTAIIGSGPAGLSCAYQLARRGYPVTVFEAFPKPGGMLRYGIPDYRLPQQVLDREIDRIKDLGVQINCSTIVGKDIQYLYLQSNFDAIFVGIGAHKGKKLSLEGEEAPNVMTGTEFLNRVNSGETPEVGNNVVVVGGGDTAIDAARVAKRLGAVEVTILYRRTRNEMPAIAEEILGAEEEDIKIEYLSAPVELIMSDGMVSGIRCRRMELGEPDSSGRRRPVPVPGSEYTVCISCLIPAISQEPDLGTLMSQGFAQDMSKNGNNWIEIDDNFATNLDKTYSGGDDVGLGLVTIAIAQGRHAAEAIISRFEPGAEKPAADDLFSQKVITHDKMVMSYFEEKARHEKFTLPPAERLANPGAEISRTLTADEAIDESKRCMSCGFCFDCGTCWSLCQDQAIKKPQSRGEAYLFKLDICQGCKKCAEQCPCGYLEMK